MTNSPRNAPDVSWHRGGSELAPSASREAFTHALINRAECLEIDVRQCGTGELVCLHDETCGSIRVSESSLQDLIDALDDLLLFDDFLALLDEHDPERHTVVHLDLKDRGYELEAVDALLKERRPFFVTTLEAPSISLLRRERPDVAALLTIGRGWKGLSRWQQLRIHAVHVFPFVPLWRTKATGVAVNFRLYRWPLKQWTKWRHLSVVVWTVDGSAALRTLLSDDSVDVVTTNYPVKALAIRDELWGKLSG